MKSTLSAMRAALAFLTRIPVGGETDAGALRAASAYFGFVGIGVGACVAVVRGLLEPASPMVAASCAALASMLLTGAMHEDGLADSADALFGTADRSRMFTILKDPRLGSFGASALVALVLVRVSALAALGPWAIAPVVCAHCVSRFACSVLMATLPYVTPSEGARSESLMGAGAGHVAVGSMAPLSVAAFVGARYGANSVALRAQFVGFVVAALVTTAFGFYVRRRAGGLTGDFLGANQQLVEAAMLVTFAGAAS